MQPDRAAAAPRAVEVVDDFQARIDTGAQLAGVPLVIDAGQIGEKVVACGIAQMAQHVQDPVRRNQVGRFRILGPRADDRIRQFGGQWSVASGQ